MGMLYENFKWDLEDRAARDRYFSILRDIRVNEYLPEYKGMHDLTVRPAMHHYVEQKYGFAMATNGAGDYTADYTVTDPKKFLLFKVKFGL